MAIYKRGRRFELGTSEKKLQLAIRAGVELGSFGLLVQPFNPSAILLSL